MGLFDGNVFVLVSVELRRSFPLEYGHEALQMCRVTQAPSHFVPYLEDSSRQKETCLSEYVTQFDGNSAKGPWKFSFDFDEVSPYSISTPHGLEESCCLLQTLSAKPGLLPSLDLPDNTE